MNPISDFEYAKNMVIMTIMWTVTSFSFYLLVFMNKYYEGSIYINFYLDGFSGIIGNILSVLVYTPLRMRYSFIISIVITIVGLIFLLIY
jgi:hypothetical protein